MKFKIGDKVVLKKRIDSIPNLYKNNIYEVSKIKDGEYLVLNNIYTSYDIPIYHEESFKLYNPDEDSVINNDIKKQLDYAYLSGYINGLKIAKAFLDNNPNDINNILDFQIKLLDEFYKEGS